MIERREVVSGSKLETTLVDPYDGLCDAFLVCHSRS